MVGDDLRNDVLAAQRVGMRGVFVRTGKGSSFVNDPRTARADAMLGERRRPPRAGSQRAAAARSAASRPSRSLRSVAAFMSAQRSQVEPRSRVCTT